ncbi:hypothetical protein [Streptomyces monashensis]|nr:hypothetical protein [Streptomyces monashensis]
MRPRRGRTSHLTHPQVAFHAEPGSRSEELLGILSTPTGEAAASERVEDQ